MANRIYLSPPDVGAAERELLLDAFDSNWIAPVGEHLDAFEREVAALAGVAHATALSTGTAGLHLGLLLLGVGRGDDVLLPTLTFVATASAVAYVGANPVFLDSDEKTWCVDPALLAEELDERARHGRLPKAVITVDIYGQCADYDAITTVCAHHGVPIIEDAAEALGASYAGKAAGSFGQVGVFSFNGNKIVTTSGGGMLVSNDQALMDRARFLATQARDDKPYYEHSTVGYNYRLSNLLAAVGRGQLIGLDQKLARRRAINERYREAFADLEGVGFLPDAPNGEPNHWLTVVTLDPVAFGNDPLRVSAHLETLDIESRPAWKPMHLQPVYRDAERLGGAVAERIFHTGLCLPSGSSLTESEQDRVIDAFRATRGSGGSLG
jgi:dTDP-4-amino-4,6-dideoxygalactose transaminase